MSTYRNLTCKSVCNVSLLTAIFLLVVLNVIFVYEFMIRLNPWYKTMGIIFEEILFALLVLSMIMTIITDPGKVDPFWHMLESTNDIKMPRKYCLLCKSFKPQRTHHCSSCHKCNLSMDHHCPWVSNCIGFRNRKFFVLFLFYVVLNLIFVLSSEIPLLIKEMKMLLNNQKQTDGHSAIQILAVLIEIFAFFLLVFFFAYHLDLVLNNVNTIEEMDQQRRVKHESHQNNGGNSYEQEKYDHPYNGQWMKNYNVGSYNNFCQVFGTNCLTWFLPIHPRSTVNGWKWPTAKTGR